MPALPPLPLPPSPEASLGETSLGAPASPLPPQLLHAPASAASGLPETLLPAPLTPFPAALVPALEIEPATSSARYSNVNGRWSTLHEANAASANHGLKGLKCVKRFLIIDAPRRTRCRSVLRT